MNELRGTVMQYLLLLKVVFMKYKKNKSLILSLEKTCLIRVANQQIAYLTNPANHLSLKLEQC